MTLSVIYDGAFCNNNEQLKAGNYCDEEAYLERSQTFAMDLFCENSLRLLVVNYFPKKAL